jgi:hypothetical protein
MTFGALNPSNVRARLAEYGFKRGDYSKVIVSWGGQGS